MTKASTAVAVQDTPSTNVQTTTPSFLASKIEADAGKGVSTLADDNLVPLIYVLQAQSPQCNKRGPDYVEGAEDGAIWLKNSGLAAIAGDVGILFQPCVFEKNWVEWVPRTAGGGFAGRHNQKPETAVEKAMDPAQPDSLSWVLPNGNIVKETRYHIGIVHLPDGGRRPYVIPMSGSNHTPSRGFMTMIGSKQEGGHTAPSWAALYLLRTKSKTNKKGTWSLWDVSDAGWVQSEDDYDRGAKLHASFTSGEKTIDAEDDTAKHDEGGGNAAM